MPPSPIEYSIVIAGPTAIGKTAAALCLAKMAPHHFEVVSADSIQTYRRFDIGSAKPTSDERQRVPFHLIDVAEPDQDFTLVDYQSLALAALEDIVSRGRVPLIVGGTGLYIRALTDGLGIPLAGPDAALRAELACFAREEGTPALHDRLRCVDPASAERIHPNDLKRIVRALEVHMLTGRPLSRWHGEDAARVRAKPKLFAVLDRKRENLYRVIDERTVLMFQNGIIGEVAALRAEGYAPTLKPMTALGYLQANKVVDGDWSVAQATDAAKIATRQYARRQLIWFRGEPTAHWIEVENKTVEQTAQEIAEMARI